jgi:hypothetical protein
MNTDVTNAKLTSTPYAHIVSEKQKLPAPPAGWYLQEYTQHQVFSSKGLDFIQREDSDGTKRLIN